MSARPQSIEEWSRQAYTLSSSDPALGTILSKSFNLMATVEKGGVKAPTLRYAMESMKRERELAMEFDQNKDDTQRRFFYAMSESLETMVNSLMTRYNGHGTSASIAQPQASEPATVVVERSSTSAVFDPLQDEQNSSMMFGMKEEEMDHMSGDGDESEESQLLPRLPGDVRDPSMTKYVFGDYEDFDEDVPTSSNKRFRNESDSYNERDQGSSTGSAVKPNRNRGEKGKTTCEVCSKSFRCPADLLDHMGWHTGEKSFTCDQCGSKFLRSSYLKKHLRRVHGANPFQCETCDASFALLNDLRKHWEVEGHKP